MMVAQVQDLWLLTRSRPQIDPNDLAEALVHQAEEKDLDYRTRLLVRDTVEALKTYWGATKWGRWLEICPQRHSIESICQEDFEEIGFPSLGKRIMDKTTPETIRQYLETLSKKIRKPLRIYIAGSGALILMGYLHRHTEDIDLIDEVPQEIREQYQVLEDLEKTFGLHLGHVQSHYFPSGWMERTHSYVVFGLLQISLVDIYDVFLSKLFSSRIKDLGDLRVLTPQVEKDVLVRRYVETCGIFLTIPRLMEIAKDNWHILFGENPPQ